MLNEDVRVNIKNMMFHQEFYVKKLIGIKPEVLAKCTCFSYIIIKRLNNHVFLHAFKFQSFSLRILMNIVKTFKLYYVSEYLKKKKIIITL